MATSTTTTARDRGLHPKVSARKQLETQRRKLDPAWVQRVSLDIQKRALALPEFQRAPILGCFLATAREVQTALIIETALAQGKRVCVPAWRSDERRYEFCEYRADFQLQPGPYQILEPRDPRWILPDLLELLFVPAVGFDVHGRRLGHGGGHYDRLMAASRCPRVCLAFELQRMAAVPVEEHDLPVDVIVTEGAFYDARPRRS